MSKGSDKNKLILVIVLFILVAIVFAWQLKLFGGGGSSSPQSPKAEVPVNPDNPGAPAPEETPGNRRTPPQ